MPKKKDTAAASNLLNLKEPPTPELDREQTHVGDSRIILDFMEWLQTEWYTREVDRRGHEHDGEDIDVCDVPANTILYEYFDLDPKKLEHERQLLLLFARKTAEAISQERALESEDMTPAEKALLILSRVREAEKRIRKEMGL